MKWEFRKTDDYGELIFSGEITVQCISELLPVLFRFFGNAEGMECRVFQRRETVYVGHGIERMLPDVPRHMLFRPRHRHLYQVAGESEAGNLRKGENFLDSPGNDAKVSHGKQIQKCRARQDNPGTAVDGQIQPPESDG